MSALELRPDEQRVERELDAHWFGPARAESSGGAPDLITASWERCRALGVDPEGGISTVILPPDELEKRRTASSRLLRVAEPLMSSLYEVVAGSGHVIVLVDSDGYVLSATGDPSVLESARAVNFVPGVRWTERLVGTTAIGIALASGRPAQVAGEEHFCRAHRAWTCSAAPIRDPAGGVLGALNVSGLGTRPHRHTLGMVVATARAIENQLGVEKALADLALASKYQAAIVEHISDGLLTVDAEGRVTYMNSAGGRILGVDHKAVVGQHVSDIVDFRPVILNVIKTGEGYIDREFVVNSKRGALHFIKSAVPIRDEHGRLTGVVDVFREIRRVRRLVHYMVGAFANFTFDDIIGDAPAMREAKRLAETAAKTSSNVLILGESGTGKEMFAQAIHNASAVKDGPFVAINCAAIPRELVESELFGYEKGAFTGARASGHPGKFELASGGTILLDEIGEMSLDVQAKLLRVLQERRITRVGGDVVLPVDARVVAASNRDLAHDVAEGNFRQDLYYRLNVFTITVPPLRERKSDIPILVRHFLEKVGRKLGKESVKVTPQAMNILVGHDWPGNVRELENVVERTLAVISGDTLDVEHLPGYLRERHGAPQGAPDQASATAALEVWSLAEAERRAVEAALAAYGGNVSRAAKALGISRNTLYCKMRKFGISTGDLPGAIGGEATGVVI
ncbi:MAG TPA: sigma 54-interacting transcriptional regulator [Firmicutes bacterium]|nr:sigma 54-interacting transcriptional regulator [Bacillota bacterium]